MHHRAPPRAVMMDAAETSISERHAQDGEPSIDKDKRVRVTMRWPRKAAP